jgi:hypothetical protein
MVSKTNKPKIDAYNAAQLLGLDEGPNMSAASAPAKSPKNIFGRERPNPLLSGGESRTVNEVGEDSPRSVNEAGEDHPEYFQGGTVKETPTVLPSYDKGTPYVPEDQIAQIHEGEEVVPADENPNNPDAKNPGFGTVDLGAPKPSDLLLADSNTSDESKAQAPSGFGSAVPVVGPYGNAMSKPQAAPEDHAALIQADKEEAAKKGDLVGLGSTLLAEKHAMPDLGFGSAVLPKYTGPLASRQQAPAPGDLISPKNLQTDEDLYARPSTPQEFKTRRDELKATILNAETQGDRERAGTARVALAELEKQSPYGSAINHPGLLGKIEHGLAKVGNIAGDIFAPGTMALIPGTDLHRAVEKGNGFGEIKQASDENLQNAEADKDKAAARSAGADTKLAGQLLLKGYVVSKDASGEPTLTQIPGFRDAPKTLQEGHASAVQDAIDRGVDPSKDPKVQQWQDAIQSVQKASTPGQEANKLAFQNTVGKIANKFSTDPKKLDESLEKAKKDGTITPEEYSAAKAYQAANPNAATTFNVNTGEAEAKQKLHDARSYFTYTDADGKTQMATGDKIPADAQGVLPIKDPQAYIAAGENLNITQKAFSKLADDNIKIFDNPTARAVLDTALDENQAAHIGFLVAGTGGQITLPSGSGKLIDQLLENNAVPAALRNDVKNYIVDYYSAKDKLIGLQMAFQNGKIGRGSQVTIQAMFSQLPGAGTNGSAMAQRSLDNLRSFADDVQERYPENYGQYKKQTSKSETPSEQNSKLHYNSAKGEIFSNDGVTWYDAQGNKVGK